MIYQEWQPAICFIDESGQMQPRLGEHSCVCGFFVSPSKIGEIDDFVRTMKCEMAVNVVGREVKGKELDKSREGRTWVEAAVKLLRNVNAHIHLLHVPSTTEWSSQVLREYHVLLSTFESAVDAYQARFRNENAGALDIVPLQALTMLKQAAGQSSIFMRTLWKFLSQSAATFNSRNLLVLPDFVLDRRLDQSKDYLYSVFARFVYHSEFSDTFAGRLSLHDYFRIDPPALRFQSTDEGAAPGLAIADLLAYGRNKIARGADEDGFWSEVLGPWEEYVQPKLSKQKDG